MKKLLLPLSILLLIASCAKQDMPQPARTDDANVHSFSAAQRLPGDSTVSTRPQGEKPIPKDKAPDIKL